MSNFDPRQKDLGLEKYETKRLFLHLFFPTLLVVITVVQLQVFHEKYLERIEIRNLSNFEKSVASGIQSSPNVNYVSLEPESPLEQQPKGSRDHRSIPDSKSLTTEMVPIKTK